MPVALSEYPMYSVPLRSYNLSNIANIRRMLYSDSITNEIRYQPITDAKSIDELVNDLYTSGKRVVFTMGKGGVGKNDLSHRNSLEINKARCKGSSYHY